MTESFFEKILKTCKPFRLLCIGQPGVGKTSLINEVFGLSNVIGDDPREFKVEVETEYSPLENKSLILHDHSNGWDNDNFVKVKNFILRRSEEHLESKDRLHVIWLCIVTPRAASRLFEKGDTKLLQLAHENNIPIVIVFTKYDTLVKYNTSQLWKKGNTTEERAQVLERGRKAANEEFKKHIQYLEILAKQLDIPMPDYAKVSVYPGQYSEGVSALFEATSLAILFDTFNNSSG